MFSFLRSRLRFAGRIGWIDGRRGYPGDEHFVELVLHRPAPAQSAPELAEQARPNDDRVRGATRSLAADAHR